MRTSFIWLLNVQSAEKVTRCTFLLFTGWERGIGSWESDFRGWNFIIFHFISLKVRLARSQSVRKMLVMLESNFGKNLVQVLLFIGKLLD